MQVQSINPSFNGRRDNVDALVALDDNTIRQVAYLKTASEYNPKKDRRVTNALFYSAPIAAGIATAVLSRGGKAKFLSTPVSGLGRRAAEGLAVAGGWAAALGAIDLLGFGKQKLAENSREVRRFDREHPIVSIGLMLAAAVGAVCLVNKGASKLLTKKAPKFLGNAIKSADKFLNTNKTVQTAKGHLLKLAEKTPATLKNIGATALDWAPTMLLFGGLFHSINSSSRQGRAFVKNYTEIKDKQAAITQARLRELEMQNDFLMQDPQNREDIELLRNPMAGI